MRARDRGDPDRRLFEMVSKLRVVVLGRLQAQHAGDDRQAVLDPVVHLFQQNLVADERGLEAALVSLAFDRHAEDIGCALQKGDVLRHELVVRPAVDLQHAERLAVTLQDDIHGAADAMLHEQVGRPEALFVFEMIGDDGLARPQGKAGRGCEVGAHGRDADDARTPAHSRPHEEVVLGRNVFEDLTELGAQPLRREPRRLRQQLIECRALERHDSKFRQNLLLSNALLQGPQRHIRRVGARPRLDHGDAFVV